VADSKTLLQCCLYFTANALARSVTRLAEDAFAPLALAPSQAFLLMLALEEPGVSPKELAARLRLAPSTVTRLVDGLARKGLVEKRSLGKAVHVHPTERGRSLAPDMAACWKSLHKAYSDVLGEQAGSELTRLNHESCRKLDGEA